jgi:SnoaL-like domain
MKKERYADYIRRFNAKDPSAFDDYLAPNVHVQNGTLEYWGIQGMKDHYAKIWTTFTEELHVERYVSDEETVAVQLWTHFTAQRDDESSLFGSVKAGEMFDYRGLVMYCIEDCRFSDIKVAYNSFVFTNVQGQLTSLGIPH